MRSLLKKMVKGVISFLLGSNEKFTLEHRFLNFICLIAVVGLLIALPINYYIDYEVHIFIANIIFFVLSLILFFFARIQKRFMPTTWIAYIVFTLLFVLLWVFEGGTSSPTLYTFIAHMAIFMWIFPLRQRFPAFIVLFVILSLLFFVEYRYPTFLSSRPILDTTPLDQYLVFIIVFVIIFLFTLFTRRHYLLEKENAKKSDKLKSAFIANLSHEVRTPLNGILGFADLIVQEDLTEEEKQEYTESMNQCSKSLLALVNDMIELSRIEAGDYHASYDVVNPANILKDVLKDLEGIKKEYHREDIPVHSEIEFEGDIVSDAFALKHIAKNLLSNAVKFTHEGEIKVVQRKVRNKLILEVKDTGIGMSKDAKKIIWNSFRQVDGSNTREYGGTGMGLTLTKGFIDALSGKVKVKSTLTKGSHFKVIIPIP
ncbi:MAG: sensor histidine kinase [Hyphomicrobiales bacterium]